MNNTPETTEPPVAEPVEQVSVVIVSCNRVAALRASLTALNGAVQRPAMQLIVVDNGSSDGSAGLESEFPATQFLRLPQNFGLTKALNIGIRACDGAYILLLHEDVEISLEAVELLRAELEQNSDTGAACPLLLDSTGKPVPQIRALPSPANPDPEFRPAKPGETAVADGAVTGAAIMVRRLLIDAMRRIDERYGNYGSDIELSMQVRRANKKVVIVQAATAVHRPEEPAERAAFAADRQLGTAAFLGKYHGFAANLKYRVGCIFGALFTFKLGKLGYLLSGRKIDGA